MGSRRDTWHRMLLLAAVLGLIWTTLVAAGDGSGALAEPEPEQPAVEEPALEEPSTEEPPAEEPPAEEPVAEEPVAEEPVAEEPVAEELPADDGAAEEPPAEEPSEDDAPDEPATEAPAPDEEADAAAEEPASEEPPADEPPAEEAPAEEPAPVEEPPAEELPTDERPVEEPPAKEQPPPAEELPSPAPDEPPPADDRAVARLTTITTRKVTDPTGTKQSFPFTVTGPGFDDSFSLTNDESHTSTLPGAGSYTLAETVPGGWQVVDIECTDGASKQSSGGTASITLEVAANDSWSCTVTDRQQATIVIEKNVDFDDGTGFDFTGGLGDFTIDPDGLSGSQVFPGLDPDVDYTVTEVVPDGWDFAGVLCSDQTSSDSPTVTLDPAPGQTLTCTFANEAQQGTVTVVKQADPVDGTPFSFGGDLGDFTLVAESEPPPPDPGPPERSARPRSEHEVTFTVDPGAYDVVEDLPAGWLLRSVECTSGDDGGPGPGRQAANGVTAVVGPGEDVTCTFANVKLASLTVVKDAEPSDGTRFPVTVTEEAPGRPGGGQVGAFELTDGGEETLPDLPPGRYVIAEDPPDGWGLASVDCGGAAVGPGTEPHSVIVTVGGGESVRCTLENRTSAEITIAKQADVDDGTLFPFSGDLGDFFLTSAPGGNGEEGVRGREEEPEPPPTGDGSLTFTVDPGTYVVTEGESAGWDLADIACQGGTTTIGDGSPGPRATVPPDSVEIVAAAGDVIVCTFLNEAQPGSLTIRKQADPADGTEFEFTFAPGEGAQSFSLRDGEERAFPDLAPATYRVVEQPPPGWGVSEIDCGPAEAAIDTAAGAVDVTVGPGDDVTCEFSNRDRATITIVKDAAPPDGTDFGFSGDLGRFELDVEPPSEPPDDGEEDDEPPPPQPRQEEDGEDENLPDRMTFEVAPGSYTVTEDASEAWELVAIVCGEEAPPPPDPPPPDPRAATAVDLEKRSVTIEVAAGEDVECTFRNRPGPVALTLVKEADPADGTVFEVQVLPAGGSPATVDLRDGEQATLEVAVGDVVITERLPSGWGMREVRCDGPASFDRALATARVTLRPGTPQTCTLVNTRMARITISKLAAPLVATAFGFTGDLGSFTLTAHPPPPDEPPDDGGGEDEEAEQRVRAAAEEGEPPPEAFAVEVDPGTYAVTEQATPGWELVAIACDGFTTDPRPPEEPRPRDHADSAVSIDLPSASAKLTVAPGDDVRCEFENRQTRRGLTIVKEAAPADGTTFDFAIDAELRPPVGFTLGDGAEMAFEIDGPVVVTETAVAGWDLVAIACDVPGAEIDVAVGRLAIDLPAGAAATCTFTNHRRGAVTVIKSTSPAGGEGFPFALRGDGVDEEFVLDDGGRVTVSDLPAGDYALTEQVPPGWALRDVSCRGAGDVSPNGATVALELPPGGNVVCTFADVKLGSLRGELFLDLDGDGERDAGEPDLADVSVEAAWAGFDGTFGTGDDGEFSTRSEAGNSYAFEDLPPGEYRVTVDEPDGLLATTGTSFDLDLQPGEAATGAAFGFAGADLELTLTSSTTALRATQAFQLTVVVLNRGPQAPGGVTARVELSPGLRFDRATGDGSYDAATGLWTIGDVPAGASPTLTLTVTPERAGDVVRAEAEVATSGLLDPDSTPGNDDPSEDDQDATASFTVGLAPAELLPVTGFEAGGLAPAALVFLLGGLILVAAGRISIAGGHAGRRRRT